MTAPRLPIAVAHLDESCLGNGREGDNPGGAGGLVEARTSKGIERREFFIHAPATTNNRMALGGAIALLQLLSAKGNRLRVLLISDSEYLVRGVREWLPGWVSRGWKRKAGAIENLELWRALHASLAKHDVQLVWVRGHAGHAKNEFANDLAVRAAREQVTSEGMVASTFAEWLEGQRAKGRYLEYDPDQTFAALERRVAGGERLPLALEEATGTAGGSR
ncbi:MAG: ribonuclease HI [Gemmatimonadetes bacterium]|nr:ribonuclease HI [Gemmatimonadota bacterium]MCC7132580.1 ribonuclease HI [Gemmatimonadales bacterium]